MNIALIAKLYALVPLHQLLQKWTAPTHPAPQAEMVQHSCLRQNATKFVAVKANCTGGVAKNHTKMRPLRVVRVVEAGQHRSSVGRMVISGRMADVCAELDRLAARETALV